VQSEESRDRSELHATVEDVHVLEATEEHSAYLEPRIRKIDHDHLVALGSPTQDIFESSRRLSDVALTVINGVPLAMFGCRRIQMPHGSTFGLVWLMGSESFSKQSRWIVKNGAHWVDHITQGCEVSGNVVSCRNRVHVRWLRWMGYDFVRKVPMGNEMFWEFVK
jgi:hypothetical protein